MTAFTSRLECEAAARVYHGGVRVPYRFATTDAEDNSVDTSHDDYYHGIELMASQNCAHANNRCLPINYIKYEGKPFAAEKISALPVRVPLKMEVVRANQQSVKGAPDTSIPLVNTRHDPKPTGELRVEASSPFIVSRNGDLSCSDIPTPRLAYADTDNYPVSTSDTSIKSTDIYVMSCTATLTHQEDDPQLEIHQMKAARQRSGDYDVDPGLLRIRHYQHINMENPVASLSPEPDDIRFTQARRWHAVTLNTVSSANLANAVVIANPGDEDPIVEIATSTTSDLRPDYCSNGADTDDEITVSRGNTFYLSMCEAGTGEVEIRNATSGELLNRYTASMSSSTTTIPTLRPTVQPTTVANTCPTITLRDRTQTWHGRWSTSDCLSDYRPSSRYADYYLIQPRANATVTIDLESSIDTYLVLYENGTTAAHYATHNDDNPSGGLNSRLTYDLQVGTNYYIEATTFGRYQTGSYQLRLTVSQATNTTPVVTPSVPTNLSATAGNARVTLSWNTASNATGYDIREWDPTRRSWAILPTSRYSGTGTQATVTGLTNGATYYYQVRGSNTHRESGWSSSVRVVPTVTLTAPTGLTGSGGTNLVVLSWTAVTNATSYEVQQWDSVSRSWIILPHSEFTVSQTGRTAVVRGLLADTTYYHQVRAVNGQIRSPWVQGWSTTRTRP